MTRWAFFAGLLAVACSPTPDVAVVSPTDALGVSPDGQIGSDATPGGVAGGTWLACLDLAQAYCTRLQACLPVQVAGDYGTQATCAQREALRCTSVLTAPFVVWDAAGLAACRATVLQGTCDDLVPGALPVCAYQPGGLPDGSPCGHDAQCKGGWCQLDGKACGKCGPRVPVGAKCVWSQCQPPAACIWNPQAKEQRCVARAMPGQACQSEPGCVLGHVCQQGKCRAETALGQACKAGDCDGRLGHDCDQKTQTCLAVPLNEAGTLCNVTGISTDHRWLCRDSDCKNQNDFGKGECQAYAADDAPCKAWEGPPCRPPATCREGFCRLPTPGACVL